MAYKQISPRPIVEGGTNATSFATTDGTTYFDGSKIAVTATGSATQLLTSNGAGMAPTYQAASGGAGMSFFSTLGVSNSDTSKNIILAIPGSKTYQTANGYSQPVNGYTATQTYTHCIIPISITCLNLYVNVAANASTTTVTITLNKNSVNTSVVVSIPALTTGTFSDTTHSVTFAAGDLLQWEMAASTTGNITGSITMAYHG